MEFDEMKTNADNVADLMSRDLDYSVAGLYSTLTNQPTKYSGKGRPKNSDYSLFKHPFDGKITKSINRA